MRTLRVQVGEVIENRARVEWRLDECSWKGVLHINLPNGIEDGPVIAELSALRYLILEKKMLGHDSAPKGSLIVVSLGAIKKLLRQDTAKSHIVPYGRFLYLALDGCEMDVKKDRTLSTLPARVILQDDEPIEAPEITLDAVRSSWPVIPFVAVDNAMVEITRHALERYQERFDTPYVRTAMNGLKKIMTSPIVRELDKGEVSRRNALRKHQKSGRHFLYGPSQTILVLIQEDGAWVLATVYRDEEKNKFKEAVFTHGRVEIRNKR